MTQSWTSDSLTRLLSSQAEARVWAGRLRRSSPPTELALLSWRVGRGALDDTVTSLHALGSPDAVGITVDMTDPDSIAGGFQEVGER